MSSIKHGVTQELLLEYLSYDKITGVLTWLKKLSRKTNVKSRAGTVSVSSGYRSLQFMGKSFPEHHVIWCMNYGYWPEQQVDHIDHNRANNVLDNLREVTIAQNARNRMRRRGTKVEEAGIWFCRRRGRYVSEITMNGKKVYQKLFKAEDIEHAIQQRKDKLLELGFHENHGN